MMDRNIFRIFNFSSIYTIKYNKTFFHPYGLAQDIFSADLSAPLRIVHHDMLGKLDALPRLALVKQAIAQSVVGALMRIDPHLILS